MRYSNNRMTGSRYRMRKKEWPLQHSALGISSEWLGLRAIALKSLHEDPDRVRTPLIKRDGKFEPATWDEAFAEIDRRLTPILEAGGRNAAATYLGNPSAHNLETMIYGRVPITAHSCG